jgi:hypothetical protein
MLSYLFDLAFVLIVGLTALFIARGMMMVEAALTFLAVVISSLVAITVFEPIAAWCVRHLFVSTDVYVTKYLWAAFAIFIFLLVFAVLQQAFLRVLGDVPQFGRLAESVGCWGWGVLAGYVLAAFLLTISQTMPVPRDVWGTFEPEAHLRRGPIMAFAPDYQFLSLVDYVCEPRAALTGMPWTVGGPLNAAELDQGYWSAFPIRYALWREFPEFIASDRGQPDASDVSDAYGFDEDPEVSNVLAEDAENSTDGEATAELVPNQSAQDSENPRQDAEDKS